MKTHLGALAALLPLLAALAAGCSSKRDSSSPVPGTGVSRDGKLSYVLEPEADLLIVSDRKTKATIAQVRVGKAPEQLAVAADETIYVANRGSRTVSVIAKGTWKVASRILVGLEPLALAVSPDNQTLYVVNGSSLESAETGSLMAINLSDRSLRWELPIDGEPRSFSLVDGQTAKIDLYRGAEPLWVNLRIPAISGHGPLAVAPQAREGRRMPRPFPALHATGP